MRYRAMVTGSAYPPAWLVPYVPAPPPTAHRYIISSWFVAGVHTSIGNSIPPSGTCLAVAAVLALPYIKPHPAHPAHPPSPLHLFPRCFRSNSPRLTLLPRQPVVIAVIMSFSVFRGTSRALRCLPKGTVPATRPRMSGVRCISTSNSEGQQQVRRLAFRPFPGFRIPLLTWVAL